MCLSAIWESPGVSVTRSDEVHGYGRRVAVAGADLLSRVCSFLLAKTGTFFYVSVVTVSSVGGKADKVG